jgi:hypothetical protein
LLGKEKAAMLQLDRKSRPARNKLRRRSQSIRSHWRSARLTAILSFFCLAVIAFGFALVENTQVVFGQSTQTTSSCKPTTFQTNTYTAPEHWFSIHSGSAADILSAVQCTDMFQSALQGNDLIAYALKNGTLSTPVLVKPYRSDSRLAQYWVVPVVDKNVYPLALLKFIYDPPSRLIHESGFAAVTGDMFYMNHHFPAVQAAGAIAAVSREHHIAALQGRAPELIYFPGDDVGLQAGKYQWAGGGNVIIDPIWRVPGTDGKWHYVDHDGHAHLSTELPVDPAYQPIPATTDIQ